MRIFSRGDVNKVDASKIDAYINRIATNDKEALGELYHITSASVYGFALSILKNMQDAEDVLHDTYLKIYTSASGYKSKESLWPGYLQLLGTYLT